MMGKVNTVKLALSRCCERLIQKTPFSGFTLISLYLLTSIVDLKPDTNSPPPTDSQVAPLEQFVPTRTYQLVVLRPLVYVHAASHSSEGSTAVREHHSKRKKVRFSRRFKNIFLQYQ